MPQLHTIARPFMAAALLLVLMPIAGAADDYRFPISGNTDVMVWEAEHWDGRLAVDIGVHPGLAAGRPERTAFYNAAVVAVTAGVVSRLDNPRGGTAVVLHADDGRTYYYAHLREAALNEPTRVAPGTVLGTIGNSGTWSQFLEPHLHFSIANGHQHGLDWTADVDPVRWLEQTFGRSPLPVPQTSLAGATGILYPRDEPEGLPLFSGYQVTSTYAEVAEQTPLLSGVRIAPRGYNPDRRESARQLAVRATMTGVVRVHRDTPLGLRIQITNGRARFSVLISGVIEPIVTTGELVFADQVIGFAASEIHYTVFQNGRLAGPEWFASE